MDAQYFDGHTVGKGPVQVRGTYKRPQAGMNMTYLGDRKEINLIGVENSGDWRRMRRN